MTRNTTALMIAAGLALGLATAGPAAAQPQRYQRPLAITIDLAYINLAAPPRWLAIGPGLEWRVNRVVMINPDLAFWFPDSLHGEIKVVPGLTVNLRYDRFFVGGGIVKRVGEWSADTDSLVVPKIQAGYLVGGAKIVLTLHIPGGGNDIAFGFTISTRIFSPGRRGPD